MLPGSDVPWWKRTTTYQIYPRSFADADADGVGDLRGVIRKLDYLQSLNVETLWLSPFFDSPQADFGYDIRDHFSVASEYGSLEDCRELIRDVHARGMRIVLDMVLNHTSDRHPWFLESRSSRTNPKRDFYIWRDGRKPRGKAPPNNWKSMLGGSGWRYDANTEQWYYASFLGFQPDLNYRNPVVRETMLDVVRFWLREGADGLRLDIFNAIFKDGSFADNPFSWRPAPSEESPHGFFQRNQHTVDHPDTLAFARELRQVVDEFSDPPRFLVGEVFGDAKSVRRYCGEAADGLHLVFIFKTLRMPHHGRGIRAVVEEIEHAFPEPFSPTYVFGNHDRPRSLRRAKLNNELAKLRAALQLTVRGVPFIYYGEEIGMENHDIPLHEGLDPIAARFKFIPQWVARYLRRHGILLNRDECRSPMQWDSGPNAGFSAEGVRPWLPVHPRSQEINVAVQEKDNASLLNCYRHLLALRRAHPALQIGELRWLQDASLPRDVVAFSRSCEDPAIHGIDVYLNFSKRPAVVELHNHAGRGEFSTHTCAIEPLENQYRTLGPYEGIVVIPLRLSGDTTG